MAPVQSRYHDRLRLKKPSCEQEKALFGTLVDRLNAEGAFVVYRVVMQELPIVEE